MPALLQIEPTTRCNLRCSHCPRVILGLPGKDMEFSNFKKIVDACPCLPLLHLQGLGEPLLHPEFFGMVEYAAQRGTLVGTCTNGHVLSPAILQSLAASSLSYLAISIDAIGGALERLREGSDHALLAKNIEVIAAAKNRGTMLAFWVVVQERNLGELDEIIELAETRRVGHILFTFVHAAFATAATGGPLPQTRAQPEMKALRKRLAGQCRRAGILSSFSTTALNRRLKNCRWPWYAGSITAEGNALPCCLIHDTYVLGNILEEDFEQIWNGEKYGEFRRALKSDAPPESCRNCQYL